MAFAVQLAIDVSPVQTEFAGHCIQEPPDVVLYQPALHVHLAYEPAPDCEFAPQLLRLPLRHSVLGGHRLQLEPLAP